MIYQQQQEMIRPKKKGKGKKKKARNQDPRNVKYPKFSAQNFVNPQFYQQEQHDEILEEANEEDDEAEVINQGQVPHEEMQEQQTEEDQIEDAGEDASELPEEMQQMDPQQ